MFGWLKKKPKDDVPIIGTNASLTGHTPVKPYVFIVQEIALTVSDDYDKFLTEAILSWEHKQAKAVTPETERAITLFVRVLVDIRQRGRDATTETMNILKGS